MRIILGKDMTEASKRMQMRKANKDENTRR